MPNEPEPPPIKYPPWVRKEILLPVVGIALLGLIIGNVLVFRSIRKERRYSPVEYGPMDHRPRPEPTNASPSNAPASLQQQPPPALTP